MTIPSEYFKEGYVHEVALMLSLDAFEVAEPDGTLRRKTLFYGGGERPDIPEFHCSLGDRENALERSVHKDGYLQSLLVPPAGRSYDDLTEPMEVRPNQDVTLHMALFGDLPSSIAPQRAVAVPLLAGVPAGDPVYFENSSQTSTIEARVDYRDQITLEMPEEPGIYPAMVGVWQSPYESALTPDFEKHDVGGNSYTQSNMLFFEVVDQSDSE